MTSSFLQIQCQGRRTLASCASGAHYKDMPFHDSALYAPVQMSPADSRMPPSAFKTTSYISRLSGLRNGQTGIFLIWRPYEILPNGGIVCMIPSCLDYPRAILTNVAGDRPDQAAEVNIKPTYQKQEQTSYLRIERKHSLFFLSALTFAGDVQVWEARALLLKRKRPVVPM